ncbi:CorA family divalent cation transporter [Roseburia sp. MSJ-14]|uniref:CorA family divalent cation transporter n=1 Tax=Roseburia sp. MSJ-14 TaxID=2841514 RepID=UPI001C122415|nr:CorA family divalent cation transporter [Roseburia sp. MSJ-14]MBU5472522.1 hypothetical protein [Roseburia sp. MSJ-14]
MEKVRIVALKDMEEEKYLETLKKIKLDYWNGVKTTEHGICGSFQMHNGKRVKPLWMVFFLNRQEFLLVTLKDETDILKEVKEQKSGITQQEGVAIIFDTILTRGQKVVEEMEQYLINMEREIVAGQIERNRNQAIFECKRTLALWKNDYGQLLSVVEGVTGRKQEMSEECACYFRIYENKVRRMNEQIQFLYEELVHVREALDAAIAYEQNRIMKVFTTVTTVFMPLTLVAGWYGMNFVSMPELTWQYGYLFVTVLSVAVVIACILFFRKKKLL